MQTEEADGRLEPESERAKVFMEIAERVRRKIDLP